MYASILLCISHRLPTPLFESSIVTQHHTFAHTQLIHEKHSQITKDEELQEYVIVQREEVIDAMGAFIAAYLANLPEAKKMDPQQLQKALQSALKVGEGGLLRPWKKQCSSMRAWVEVSMIPYCTHLSVYILL